MKILSKSLLLLFCLFTFINSKCLRATHLQGVKAINLTDNDSGKQLVLIKGRTFSLTLPDHVDGGFRFDSAQYDNTILKLDKHWEKPPAANSALGRSGIAVWEFTAIKSGGTALKFTASRPWKGGGTVVIFENKVLVK